MWVVVLDSGPLDVDNDWRCSAPLVHLCPGVHLKQRTINCSAREALIAVLLQLQLIS